jgi:glycosyltransferase involved in cell wall biosynthesis
VPSKYNLMVMQKAEKIRLLWVAEREFDIGYAARAWAELLVILQKSYTVRLLTCYRHKKVQPEIFHNEIIYYDSSKIPYIKRFTRFISQLKAFNSVLESFKPDIVLFNCSNLFLLKHAVSMRRKYNLRLIYDIRTLPVEKSMFRNWLNGILLKSCTRFAAKYFDGMTYITDRMKQYCIDKYKLSPHKSAVWASGVNPELFCPARMTSSSGPFTILYHGTIAKKRKIDNAVKALSFLKDIDVHLVLLGRGDGLEDLKNLVESLGIQNRVTFHKPVGFEEVPKLINSCDAGIIPLQNWDGWNVSSPIKLFEYLACGKPVIVTDIPAHRQVLGACDFAFWARESSPEDLADAIRQAYYRREDFKRLGVEAQNLALEKYTWSKQAQKLDRFFVKVYES